MERVYEKQVATVTAVHRYTAWYDSSRGWGVEYSVSHKGGDFMQISWDGCADEAEARTMVDARVLNKA